MKRLLLALLLLMTATGASAEWTVVGENDRLIQYIDLRTIRKNGNLVKMWDLTNYKTVQTVSGLSFFSAIGQSEYDCKEELKRGLALGWFSEAMGNGQVVSSTSAVSTWGPFRPGSTVEALWKIACDKR
jgi:hypothetical protein